MSQMVVRKLDTKARGKKRNWRNHLQTIPSERTPKQLLHYPSIGSCNSGRRRRWQESLMSEGANKPRFKDYDDDDDDDDADDSLLTESKDVYVCHLRSCLCTLV
jgi:hypothetical protein